MKKTFTIAGIFLITYIGFLIATLPAALLFNQLPMPKNLNISGVTGSIWQTNVELIVIGDTAIQKIETQLSFWSLFTLTPKLFITFGDSFIAGPEGELELSLSAETAQISDLTLIIKANEIAQQLTLPLPVSAQGDVVITIINAEIDLKKGSQCIVAKGNATWSKAGLIALEQNIKLGTFNSEIGCENGALSLILSPKNNLGLTFNAYMRKGGKISGNGFIKPGAKFPKVLNDVLPFLGKKDNQGRYRLSF